MHMAGLHEGVCVCVRTCACVRACACARAHTPPAPRQGLRLSLVNVATVFHRSGATGLQLDKFELKYLNEQLAASSEVATGQVGGTTSSSNNNMNTYSIEYHIRTCGTPDVMQVLVCGFLVVYVHR